MLDVDDTRALILLFIPGQQALLAVLSENDIGIIFICSSRRGS